MIQVGVTDAVATSELRTQMAVGDHAHHRHRLVARHAAGQFRIVGQHRADAHQHRVAATAQHVRRPSRRLSGDPFALAAARGDPPVQRGCEL
jgi:hypothetical protein